MTGEQQKTHTPVEEALLFTAQQLTETAYERFTQGEVTQQQLKQFYDVLKVWTAASENIMDAMCRLGIQT